MDHGNRGKQLNPNNPEKGGCHANAHNPQHADYKGPCEGSPKECVPKTDEQRAADAKANASNPNQQK